MLHKIYMKISEYNDTVDTRRPWRTASRLSGSHRDRFRENIRNELSSHQAATICLDLIDGVDVSINRSDAVVVSRVMLRVLLRGPYIPSDPPMIGGKKFLETWCTTFVNYIAQANKLSGSSRAKKDAIMIAIDHESITIPKWCTTVVRESLTDVYIADYIHRRHDRHIVWSSSSEVGYPVSVICDGYYNTATRSAENAMAHPMEMDNVISYGSTLEDIARKFSGFCWLVRPIDVYKAFNGTLTKNIRGVYLSEIIDALYTTLGEDQSRDVTFLQWPVMCPGDVIIACCEKTEGHVIEGY